MEWSYLGVLVLGLCCTLPVVRGQGYDSACLPGRYGSQCEIQCPYQNCLLNTCNRKTGSCLACNAGYAGSTCTEQCSSGCVNNQCNRETRTCDCAQGYYKEGGTCRQCSSGCVNNQCNRENGTCSCLPGKYGDLCDKACLPGNCLLNTCNQTTGRCLVCNTGFGGDTCSGCAPGYYREQGGGCQQCSSGCKDNKCDDNTGKCDGCQPGYQGDNCTSLCSSRCTQCSQDGTCTACNGQFMTPSCTECVQGLSKHNTTTCSPCSAFCSTGGCDKDSGNCNGVCQAGRWGGQCEKSCPVNCEPHTCDRGIGNCKGCRPGYHGQQCNESCSTIADQCVQCTQSGQCTACSGHFQFPQCTECVEGFSKHNTTTCSPCSAFCSTGDCDKDSGNCNGGCRPGYHGQQCDESCSTIADQCVQCTQSGQCTACSGHFQLPQCTGSDQSRLAVVSGILGAGLMVTIAVLVFLCWRFRSQLIVQKQDTLTSVYADPVTAGSNAYTEPPSVALSPPDEACGNTQHEIRDPGNPYEQLRVYSNMMFDREAHSDPEPRGTDVTTPKSTSEYVNVTLEHIYANMSSGPKTKKKPRKKKAK